MSDSSLDRRTVLGTVTAAAGTLLAGCTGGGGNSGDGDGNSDGDGSGSADFGGYLDDVGNFDGVVDETGSDEVTVMVGTEANGGNFGFGPPAVRVSTGTTVVWEWTGEGSLHNVVHEGGDFESEQTDEEGFTFEHSFGSAGTYKYYCQPHKSLGMKGVVVVE